MSFLADTKWEEIAKRIQQNHFALAAVALILLVGYYLIRKLLFPSKIRVKEVWVYPIKSCKGCSMQSIQLTSKGFIYDRVFAILDKSTGKALTQRVEPRMALITVTISEGSMFVGMSTMQDVVEVPLEDFNFSKNARFSMQVWSDTVEVMDVGDVAAEWLDEALNEPGRYRLVRMPDETYRETKEILDNDVGVDKSKVNALGKNSLSDSRPLLLTTTKSLEALNHYMREHRPDGMSMDRFRPNIVVEGCDAFEEDFWQSLSFSSLKQVLFRAEPCSRCKLPTNNQQTAEFDPDNEPNVTLKRMHAGGHVGYVGGKREHETYFGVLLDHGGYDCEASGVDLAISVGDYVLIQNWNAVRKHAATAWLKSAATGGNNTSKGIKKDA